MKFYSRALLALLLIGVGTFATSQAATGPAIAVGTNGIEGLILSKPVGGKWGPLAFPGLNSLYLMSALYHPALEQYVIAGQDKNHNALIATAPADAQGGKVVVGTATRNIFPGIILALTSQGDQYLAVGADTRMNIKTMALLGKNKGVEWSDVTGNAAMLGEFMGAAAGLDENGKNQFVLVGGTDFDSNHNPQSPLVVRGTGNGNWTRTQLPPEMKGGLLSVAYNSNLHQYLMNQVEINSNGFTKSSALYRSNDGGKTWVMAREARDQGSFLSVNYIPATKQYLVTSVVQFPDHSFPILMSTDGINWQQPSPSPLITTASITYSESLGQYLGVGMNLSTLRAGIISSKEGLAWEQEIPNNDGGYFIGQLRGVATP